MIEETYRHAAFRIARLPMLKTPDACSSVDALPDHVCRDAMLHVCQLWLRCPGRANVVLIGGVGTGSDAGLVPSPRGMASCQHG